MIKEVLHTETICGYSYSIGYRQIPYIGGEVASDLHIIDINRRSGPSNDFGFLRLVVQEVRRYVESQSFDENVNSPYDCTGARFGSSWKRLDVNVDTEGVTVLLLHTYAFDV